MAKFRIPISADLDFRIRVTLRNAAASVQASLGIKAQGGADLAQLAKPLLGLDDEDVVDVSKSSTDDGKRSA